MHNIGMEHFVSGEKLPVGYAQNDRIRAASLKRKYEVNESINESHLQAKMYKSSLVPVTAILKDYQQQLHIQQQQQQHEQHHHQQSSDPNHQHQANLVQQHHHQPHHQGVIVDYASHDQNKYNNLVQETCVGSGGIGGGDGVGEDNVNGTVEYVNIMLDNNLLPVQNQIITEPNYYTDEELNTSNWNNVDLLDLDQRNLFFETTTTTTMLTTATTSTSSSMSSAMVATVQPNEQSAAIRDEFHMKMTAKNVPTTFEDSEDKNLSWLFNYKLDELPHLSPEVNRCRTETGLKVDEIIQEATATEIEDCDMVVAENVVVENTLRLPKKPPFTYTELIEYALEDKGELTVSGIYQWISDRFPYYKSNDDRWKNSVRHNLSINPHFRKGSKAAQGAGHLWTISSRDSDSNILAWEHKKQRFDMFFRLEKQNAPVRLAVVPRSSPMSLHDEAAIAASNLALLEQPQRTSMSPKPTTYASNDHNGPMAYEHLDAIDAADLRRSAGEILNGIRRTVEVQVVNPPACLFQNAMIDTDYLNPVPKDQIVRECGLRSGRNHDIGSDYYVTEIDPIELGVNMNAHGEEEVLFGDDFNLNYFGIVSGNNIMA